MLVVCGVASRRCVGLSQPQNQAGAYGLVGVGFGGIGGHLFGTKDGGHT